MAAKNRRFRAVVTSVSGEINTSRIPSYVTFTLAQTAFAGIREAYRDPVIRADYERWKAARAAKGQ